MVKEYLQQRINYRRMKGKAMSKKGILNVAEVFSIMQNVRIELMDNKGKDPSSLEYHQDLRLATLLDEMKDFGKEKFSKITMMKTK
jgi:hypothetical protein